MTKANKIGIFMDHSTAHLMEFTTDIKTTILKSEFTHEAKENSLEKGENLMHNREQHEQANYYKKLADQIRNYTHVLLFGPTAAKTELYNILKADHLFAEKHIDVLQTDKMTTNQQYAFVKAHFSKQLV